MKDLTESLEEFIFGNTGAGKKPPQGPCNNNKEKKDHFDYIDCKFLKTA